MLVVILDRALTGEEYDEVFDWVHQTYNYLEEVQSPITRQLQGTVLQIMNALFSTYSNIINQSVVAKQNQLFNYLYDTNDPITKVFALAQEYQQYSSAFGNEVTPANLINLVYNIFQKTGKYRSALEKWNEKPENEKTLK